MPRDLKTLLADGESRETLQSALDALNGEIERQDPEWCAVMRADLVQELRELETQGSLF